MKQTILTIAFLMLSLFSFSQERVNKSDIDNQINTIINNLEVIDYQTFGKIDSATGWYYDGRNWTDYKNMICDDTYKQYYTPGRSFYGFGPAVAGLAMSAGLSNFKYLQAKSYIYKSDTIFLIKMPYYFGYYRYPNIKKDWISANDTMIYIFKSSEFYKLSNIGEIVSNIYCVSSMGGNSDLDYIKNYIYKSILLIKDIEKLINQPIPSDYLPLVSSYNSSFLVKKYNNMVRFYPSRVLKPTDIEKAYYETSFENFNNLLKVKSIK